MCFLLESISTALLVASTYVSEASEGEEPRDLELIARELQLATLSAQLLVAAIYIPLAVTAYNSFLVPLVAIVWGADGDCREIMTQIFMTCILMPYEIAASFFGFGGFDTLTGILGELEGSVVEVGASSTDLLQQYEADEEGDAQNGHTESGAAESDAAQPAAGQLDSEHLEHLPDALPEDASAVVSVQEALATSVAGGVVAANAQMGASGMVARPHTSKVACVDDKKQRQKVEAPTDKEMAPPSKGAIKRMKREVFLARVRERVKAKSANATPQ